MAQIGAALCWVSFFISILYYLRFRKRGLRPSAPVTVLVFALGILSILIAIVVGVVSVREILT
jgi:hypothetical protein